MAPAFINTNIYIKNTIICNHPLQRQTSTIIEASHKCSGLLIVGAHFGGRNRGRNRGLIINKLRNNNATKHGCDIEDDFETEEDCSCSPCPEEIGARASISTCALICTSDCSYYFGMALAI